MKAEHRHQLQKNALADRMGRILQGMKSSDKSTSTMVWVFVLLALGTVAVWQYWVHATQTQNSALWTDLDVLTHDPLADSQDALEALARKSPGSLAGRTAEFQMAREIVNRGSDGLIVARSPQASENLKSALKLYQGLATQCADAPLLTQEALMEVAKAKEGLIGAASEKADEGYGTLAQAEEAYRKLANQYPDSPLGKAAKARLDELAARGPEIERFYTDLNRSLASLTPPPEPKLPDFGK